MIKGQEGGEKMKEMWFSFYQTLCLGALCIFPFILKISWSYGYFTKNKTEAQKS